MTIDRREFLKAAGAGAGLLVTGAGSLDAALAPAPTAAGEAPAMSQGRPDIVVIGAGAFGGWTALNLQKMGAKVLLVDAYGPGNSRATSGDETRGIRSSYGDRRAGQAEVWTAWARRAITKWRQWDEEWGKEMKIQLFFPTGDLIMRTAPEPFTRTTRELWDKLKIPYQVLPVDEVRYRYPVINLEGIQHVLYEPDAGVVRARRSCESVAGVFRQLGGEILVQRAWPTVARGRRMQGLQLANGSILQAETYLFACGPWLPKVFPDLLGNRMRTPLGNVFYLGAPPGDVRFDFPNMPSWNFPGVTGWPGLPADNRGFRVRTGGGANGDPDVTSRNLPATAYASKDRVVAQRFPLLVNAPVLETRSCHYESSINSNFIIDKHPAMENVWIAGAGNSEGFKFGPVIGEYTAKRVLGRDDEPALAAHYRMPTEQYEPGG